MSCFPAGFPSDNDKASTLLHHIRSSHDSLAKADAYIARGAVPSPPTTHRSTDVPVSASSSVVEQTAASRQMWYGLRTQLQPGSDSEEYRVYNGAPAYVPQLDAAVGLDRSLWSSDKVTSALGRHLRAQRANSISLSVSDATGDETAQPTPLQPALTAMSSRRLMRSGSVRDALPARCERFPFVSVLSLFLFLGLFLFLFPCLCLCVCACACACACVYACACACASACTCGCACCLLFTFWTWCITPTARDFHVLSAPLVSLPCLSMFTLATPRVRVCSLSDRPHTPMTASASAKLRSIVGVHRSKAPLVSFVRGLRSGEGGDGAG